MHHEFGFFVTKKRRPYVDPLTGSPLQSLRSNLYIIIQASTFKNGLTNDECTYVMNDTEKGNAIKLDRKLRILLVLLRYPKVKIVSKLGYGVCMDPVLSLLDCSGSQKRSHLGRNKIRIRVLFDQKEEQSNKG